MKIFSPIILSQYEKNMKHMNLTVMKCKICCIKNMIKQYRKPFTIKFSNS